LKPNYNSVDLSEIELVDSDEAYRNFGEQLMTVSCNFHQLKKILKTVSQNV